MVETVKAFLSADWKAMAAADPDSFSEMTRTHLRREMAQCAKQTEFPLKRDAENLDHESFPHFALCLRNATMTNPVLNRSSAIRENILGFTYQ